MTANPSRARDRHRWFGAVVCVVLTAWIVMPRGAGAQSASQGKAQPPAAKGGNAEAPQAMPRPLEYETVKLDNGTEVSVEKWGKTYPAYEYRPPIDILDNRVRVVLDAERDGVPQAPVTGLELDSQGGRLYWTEGLERASVTGSVRRVRLDGRGLQTLAADRVYPNSLVLDKARSRIYWLEGAGEAPCRLQSATLDGKKETTISQGLNRPKGLALDSARGQLYYWEQYRLVRVNVDGTGEKIITANRRLVNPAFGTLAFDAFRDRLFFALLANYGWLDRDATYLKVVPRLQHRAVIHGFALDERHQKVYFADNTQVIRRANPDYTQVETLVASPAVCADGWSRSIMGDVSLDPTRGQLYWTGMRMRGAAMYPTVCRTDLRPLLEPTACPAPPRITTIDPSEQSPGGEVVLSGDGLAGTVAVTFIDDSIGAHTEAKFRPIEGGRLTVTVPRLGDRCRRPVLVVQTPGGLTMTLGTDVIAPEHKPFQYEEVRTVDPEKDPWWLWANRPYQHERSVAGMGARVWLRPGLIGGKIESAVVYAMRGSSVTFGPKGMVTAFAKDDSYVAVHVFSQLDNTVVYHEPFAVLSSTFHRDTTVRHIPVPAIRPSFPKAPFRYRTD